MAWTQADLDKLDVAIANNVRKVTYSDGRAVEYHDADQMLKVRSTMKAELLASASRVSPQVRATRATMRRP